MAETSQLNIRLAANTASRYQETATKFGKKETHIAAEVLDDYLDFWIEAEESRLKYVEAQRKAYREALEKGKNPDSSS